MYRVFSHFIILAVASVSHDAVADRCTDFEDVTGTFGDILPAENFELTVKRMDDEMLQVLIDLDSNVGEGSLNAVFLRLSGAGEMPTVISISLEKVSEGRFRGEYWILNSDYTRSGLMVRYNFWRNDPSQNCLAKRMTYFVPMPANKSLEQPGHE